FVSGEAGGLASRMLLLEAKGENFRGTAREIVNYSEEIVREEGPAIMLWALEASIADYADAEQAAYRELTAEMVTAARSYTRENSIFVQWVESRQMQVGEDLSIDTMEAFDMFRAYAKEVDDKTAVRMKLSDFRLGLRAAYPSISFERRTERPHCG